MVGSFPCRFCFWGGGGGRGFRVRVRALLPILVYVDPIQRGTNRKRPYTSQGILFARRQRRYNTYIQTNKLLFFRKEEEEEDVSTPRHRLHSVPPHSDR